MEGLFVATTSKLYKESGNSSFLSLLVIIIDSYQNKFDATQKLWLLYKQGNSRIPKRIIYSQDKGYTADTEESTMPSRNASVRGSISNVEKAQEIQRLFLDSILKAFIFNWYIYFTLQHLLLQMRISTYFV